jgi:hypothetical protein
MKINNKELLELLSKQLLFAAQNLNKSDSDSGLESLVHQLGTYGQVCPDCEEEHLQDAADDWVFDLVYHTAHNKQLLRLFIRCAYSHLSKQDVDILFRQTESEWCEDADEEQMHFHLTGEHYEDCECPECHEGRERGEFLDDECMCDECCEERKIFEVLAAMPELGPENKEAFDAAYEKFFNIRGITPKAA